MENRKPDSGSVAAERNPRSMRLLLVLGAVLVILAVLISATRLFAPGDASPWPDDRGQTFGQSAPPAQDAAADSASEQATRPALIIDDRAAGARDNPLSRIQSPPAQNATGEALAAAVPAPAAGAAANAPGRSGGTPRTRTTPRPVQEESGGDLISTLLRIIRQDDAAAGGQHASMDALVAHVLSENDRTYDETSAALASLGQARPEQAGSTRAQRPSRAQRELQACPAANTLQGINCRDRVCARYAGRDPACPAR